VVDRQFREPRLAEVYDAVCAGRDDFTFYLPLVMAAGSVLDVGCGTGELLHRARGAGHRGRLCGLDPAWAMLDQARSRADIEWNLGDLGSIDADQSFDLVVMTAHAFQVLLADDDIHAALATIRSLLGERGRFVFETRNPAARAWEAWTPDHAVEVVHAGALVRMVHQVDAVDGDLVTLTSTYTCPSWDAPEQSVSTLRFLDARALAAFLAGASLAVEAQFGDWDRRPIATTSPEIITVARPAGRRGTAWWSSAPG